MVNGVTEKTVVELWQRLAYSGLEFITEDGKVLKVLYPGRSCDDRGADFRDAVIDVGGARLSGNIELHIRSTDWELHGHHRDSAYNSVVLHVVLWHEKGYTTRLENGNQIPVLALSRYCQADIEGCDACSDSALPCQNMTRRVSEREMMQVLDHTGEDRFREKILTFHRELANARPGDCLYRGMMGALGFSRNKTPFQKLADGVPLGKLESMARTGRPAEEHLAWMQSLLLGTAGLLPSQPTDYRGKSTGDSYASWLESIWREIGATAVLTRQDWSLFRVRPGNFPVRRIAAMSYLVLKYRDVGLFTGQLALIRPAIMEKAVHVIEGGMMVTARDYWANHFDFGRTCRGLSPLLVGPSRAAEIVINVLLPFAIAFGKSVADTEMAEQALELYRQYPALAENTVAKHIRAVLGLKPAMVNTACRQQGLLHIYREFCIRGGCGRCPVINHDCS